MTKRDVICSLYCKCGCSVGSHDSAGSCNNHRECGCLRNPTVAAAYKIACGGRSRLRRKR